MRQIIVSVSALVAIILVPTNIYAWTGPTNTAPDGNVSAPLNVSSSAQSKSAGLLLNTGGATNGLLVQYGNVGIGTVTPGYKLEVSGSTFLGTTAAGHNFSLAGYSDGRSWAIRDDVGVNRLRFSRGSTDYWFWDVTKVAGSDSVSAQSWRISDGNFSWITGATTKMVIANGGNVGINEASPTFKLTVGGSVGALSFFYTSDKNLKDNIKPLNDSLDKVLSLEGVSFNWKDDGRASVGLIAQDVEKVYPELVNTNPENGLKSVEYGNLVAPLIEAIKEQQKEIEILKSEIEVIKAQANK